MQKTSFFLDIGPTDFDSSQLLGGFGEGSPKILKRLEDLGQAAGLKARPKAVFKICPVDIRTEELVNIGGQTFKSRLLSQNLAGLGRVFPYIVTEGLELAGWGGALTGTDQILAKSVRYAILSQATNFLESYIAEKFDLNQLSTMNPGSLPRQWPLEEQKPLFELLAPLPEKAGVSLLKNNMMSPELTTSGIFFPSECKYQICRLCPIPACPIRRAEYEAE